jgi:hypothetical protein
MAIRAESRLSLQLHGFKDGVTKAAILKSVEHKYAAIFQWQQ